MSCVEPIWYECRLGESSYPHRVSKIDDPPPILWVNKPWPPELVEESFSVVAVVGSRAMSFYGKRGVEQVVRQGVQSYHWAIVSGGARGIDRVAHEAALQAGGWTVVVLPCGKDHIPSVLEPLLAQERCIAVTEFPPEQATNRWCFAQRNRLISALSDGVFVGEARERSGTMITVAAALAQGRDVCVLTQPYTSPNVDGVLRLAAQGATVIASARHIQEWVFLGQQSLFPAAGNGKGILVLAQTAVEAQILRWLLEEGGSCAEPTLHTRAREEHWREEVWHTSVWNLELRGALIRELGVVRLTPHV